MQPGAGGGQVMAVKGRGAISPVDRLCATLVVLIQLSLQGGDRCMRKLELK